MRSTESGWLFLEQKHGTIKLKRVMTITVRCLLVYMYVYFYIQCTLYSGKGRKCVDLFKIFDRNSVITRCAFFLENKFLYFKKCPILLISALFYIPFLPPFHSYPSILDIRLISTAFPLGLYVCSNFLQLVRWMCSVRAGPGATHCNNLTYIHWK